MSYQRGSLHAASPSKGSFNRSALRTLQAGFSGLLKVVEDAANMTAYTVLSGQTAYGMSFDETEQVPVTSPAAGTVTLTGIDDPVSAEAALTQLGNQKLAEMQAALTQQLKEKGYG